MQVGSLVMWRDRKYGHHRIWQVRSICLGAAQQESLVELCSLTHNAGVDVNGDKHLTTWVPEALLWCVEVFSPAPKQ